MWGDDGKVRGRVKGERRWKSSVKGMEKGWKEEGIWEDMACRDIEFDGKADVE